MDPISVTSATSLQQDLLRQAEHAPPPPPAPAPELVSRFESLMARSPVTGVDSISDMPGVQSAVGKVESHLQHHSEAVDRVMALSSSEMSLAELQTKTTQATMELGLLSMNQAAYMQVLGSTKSTVSALMKNQ